MLAQVESQRLLFAIVIGAEHLYAAFLRKSADNVAMISSPRQIESKLSFALGSSSFCQPPADRKIIELEDKIGEENVSEDECEHPWPAFSRCAESFREADVCVEKIHSRVMNSVERIGNFP